MTSSSSRYPDFDVRNFGSKSLNKFLASLPELEVEERILANGNPHPVCPCEACTEAGQKACAAKNGKAHNAQKEVRERFVSPVRLSKKVRSPLGPLCEGGSARRRWGRELYGCPKYFGLWQGSLPSGPAGHLPPRGSQVYYTSR